MKLEGIQVVRGIAATMVAVCHIYNDGWIPGAVVDFGGFGVDLFFVISGFIMCLTIKTQAKSGLSRAADFLKKRLIRIFPLYIICALPLILYVTVKTGVKAPYYYIGNILLLPSFTDAPNYSYALPPGWTLAYEMLFYYLFVIALLCFKEKRTILIAVATVIVSTVFLVNILNVQGPRLAWVNFSFIVGHIQVLNFALGILTYFIFEKLKDKLSFSVFQWSIVFSLLSLFVIILIYFKVPRDYITILVSFIIITVTTLTENSFSNRKVGDFLLLLGNASYSIYLIHFYFAFFKPKFLFITKLFPSQEYLLLNIVNIFLLIGAVIAGILVYQNIESPITKWIGNRIRAHEQKSKRLEDGR